MRDKVNASTKADPKWKDRYVNAANYALMNQDTLTPIAEKQIAIGDAQHGLENTHGIESPYRKGYLMHMQDLDNDEPLSSILGQGTGQNASFKKMRTFDTHADSIAAGVDPKTLNAPDLLEARLKIGGNMVNDRAWVDSLKTINDPGTNTPLITNANRITRPDGSFYYEAPDGYKMQYIRGVPMAVSKDYAATFGALTNPGPFQDSSAYKLFHKLNKAGNYLRLLVDTFHLGRVAATQSAIKLGGLPEALGGEGIGTSGLSIGANDIAPNVKLPIPSYRKGITLLSNTTEEIQKMAQNGEIPKSWTNNLLEDKTNLNRLVKNGYNLGGTSDALHQDFIHNLPIVGKPLAGFQKWLFGQFQRGAMTEVGLLEYNRQKAMYPELSEDQVARNVAMDLNTRFGNLGRQGLFRSAAQDAMRAVMLAPQWNEGLLRSQLGGITQGVKSVADLATGKGFRSGALARSTGAMLLGYFLANQVINIGTRGIPTWQNPEEGLGPKISAWVPDFIGKGPGFFMNPMSLGAETIHHFVNAADRGKSFSDALKDWVQARASSATAGPAVWAFGKDSSGAPVKPGEMGMKMAEAAFPSPIPAGAALRGATQAITGNPTEQFQGQFQRQLMSSTGFKPDTAPTALTRIYGLSQEYNKTKGISNHPGEYTDLTRALLIGNKDEAQNQIRPS